MITGTKGIAKAISSSLPDCEVTAVSKSTGYDIVQWQSWIPEFYEHDVFINNAQEHYHQAEILVHLAQHWQSHANKIIINIGSTVANYPRSHGCDSKFDLYRSGKRLLQDSFDQLVRNCECRLVLINPGPTDTDMMKGKDVAKMTPETVAQHVVWCINHREIKRLDLWL